MVFTPSAPQQANTPGMATDVLLSYFALFVIIEQRGGGGSPELLPFELLNCVIDRADVGQYFIGLSVEAPRWVPKNLNVQCFPVLISDWITDSYYTHVIGLSPDAKGYYLSIFLNTIDPLTGVVTAALADPQALMVCNAAWSERSSAPFIEGRTF